MADYNAQPEGAGYLQLSVAWIEEWCRSKLPATEALPADRT